MLTGVRLCRLGRQVARRVSHSRGRIHQMRPPRAYRCLCCDNCVEWSSEMRSFLSTKYWRSTDLDDFQLAGLFMKAGPALAAGNVLILKPSEKTPLGALYVADLFRQAGFPPGVFQIVTGAGDVGAMLASHMKIRKVSCPFISCCHSPWLTQHRSALQDQ